MKWFNIRHFPKFCTECGVYGLPADKTMIKMGYKSAKFVPDHEKGRDWGLSEEEYTWFVLRWS